MDQQRHVGRSQHQHLDADATGARYLPDLMSGLLQRGSYARQVINATAMPRSEGAFE
ncbi:hypothetical protein ACIQZO_19560 [Streptomyces sp. NPDC097617]|uniref:hypothetical protein n=1 Tax=Streptomyces sp. NPDC097617 TaxID=3366091 RepID=UPI0037F9E8D2